jgi:CheY-like chemotaxis protein
MSEANFYFIAIIIILLLGIVGVYFYLNSKLKKQNNDFNKTLSKKKNIEQNKNALLSELSDDIYELTQNLVKTEDEIDTQLEDEILSSTNNLRELLKIQSNQVEIYNEKFVFSTVLDDITTYLSSNFGVRDTEVVFNIDSTVPQYLTGDVIHFGRIINNILEFSVQSTPQGKVSLNIKGVKARGNKLLLVIEIEDTGKTFRKDEIDKLFELYYDDKKNEHIGLRLYIAKKLTLAIGGSISVRTSRAKGNTFSLQIPMEVNDTSHIKELGKFNKNKLNENVLIYADKTETGLALQNLLSRFYKKVRIVKYEEIDRGSVKLNDFNILVLSSEFFTYKHKKRIREIKNNNDIHIIACHSLFKTMDDQYTDLIDDYIQTPTNMARIVELIKNIELQKSKEGQNAPILPKKEANKCFVYTEPIEETPNIDLECFTYFKGIRLLIVEDNLINQKIILSVLKKSGMEIDIANNGQEAIDFLFNEKRVYDVILMDISMPIMDGIIATKHIRENKKFDAIPIITFTAFAMGIEIEQMFKAGGNAYLTKPLNIKKLYTVFHMFLTPTSREVSRDKVIEIEGLDIQKGIANADADESLYRKTLKEFVLLNKDKIYFIPKWIDEKHFERVRLSCSEMQGILDAIGAYEMKALVDEMQKNFLYDNEAFLTKYSERYIKKLSNLIDTIQFYLKG